MQQVRFRDDEHERFYVQMMDERKCNDGYHRALFYTLGISRETRSHIRDLYDFANGGIKPEGLSAPWQTGSSTRVCRLAFNLWNGWTEVGGEHHSTPHELFDCSYALYFLKRFVFVIPNIAEITRERSNGWLNKFAEWLPATGVEWDDEGN
ncbi:hypothetical protein PACILC2_52500 [Paenibacillus cisolokensis]|uniref:Uncharacterized protein n=1 Tax=Paenibacillus cisolokensis TaxID=1658519 RepID=A0ABQ4NES4_9BACL|nr:DUF6075 family protein [Paenibacillus cisolokensis]GIQ66682.1 hypothetical protein PACILC2_52500 [Paenibacillus cisolokensis]